MPLRILIALLFCAIAAAPGKADEQGDRLVATFAKICLTKPDSANAINTLAVAQGFALDKAGTTALAEAGKKDPYNLLLFWTAGEGNNRMKLTGLISGNADRYELGCILDGFGMPPQDVLAALKPVLGEPAGRAVKDNGWTEVAWAASASRPGVVTLSFKDGMQRVSLTFVQMLGKAAK